MTNLNNSRSCSVRFTEISNVFYDNNSTTKTKKDKCFMKKPAIATIRLDTIHSSAHFEVLVAIYNNDNRVSHKNT